MNKKLRIIKRKKYSPYINMAIDEALFINNIEQNIIIRFFGWEVPSVSIGIFQKIEEINLDYIKKNNIPLVRRPTGGKGVFHDDELTYSIIVPSQHPIFKLDIIESYKIVSRIFLKSLSFFNIFGDLSKKEGESLSFCFSSKNYYEISVNGKKVIGSAQKRTRLGFLQQGSIPFTVNYEKVKKIFNLNTLENFTSLKEINKNIDINELENKLIENFIEFFNIDYELRDLDEKEMKNVKELYSSKYSKDSWNLEGIY